MASRHTDQQEFDSGGSGRGRTDQRSNHRHHRHDDRDRYFARGRIRWLRRCLDELGEQPTTMLDFGSVDVGTSAEYFAHLTIRSLVGVDVSNPADGNGKAPSGDGRATFVHVADFRAAGSIDLALTHGVFLKMPPREQAAAAVLVFRSLKPGGLFAFWEHNPWNPRARFRASEKFRTEAGPLSPPDARRLLRGVGFDIVHTTSTFFFPRGLRWCQPIEPMLALLPLGGQYMVLARKP